MRWSAIAAGIVGVCLVVGTTASHAARKEIRTVDQDDLELRDVFVNRSGPDQEEAYKLGQLGVLLPSYGRSPLYLAYRAIIVSRPTLEKQSAQTPKKTYAYDPPPTGGLAAWKEQRRLAGVAALSRDPDPYRSFPSPFFGNYLNCGDGAFKLAAETLQSLAGKAQLNQAAIHEWVTVQDTVFQLCGDPAPGEAAPSFPKELPASAPQYLRQLRQYQVAAANFYVGKYGDALTLFDLIAKDKAHPLRVWANHSALRALLRSASMDFSLAGRIREIKASGEGIDLQRESLRVAENKHRQKMAQINAQIATRAKAILADKSLASIHTPARKVVVQAGRMIVPDQLLNEASVALGRFDKDFESSGMLHDWASLGDELLAYGRNADLDARLRQSHEYFDWIRTIQGCADNLRSPNFTGRCAEENAHALDRWRRAKSRAWLVAGLVGAQAFRPEMEPLLAASRLIKPDAAEFLTVRYHAARLLRLAGRHDEAKALIDEVLAPPTYRIASGDASKMSDANNLFRQERFALAKGEEEALRYLMRDSRWRLAADGDGLLNRRLATDDLLRLAQNSAVDGKLRSQLLIAAWWRADLLERTSDAQAAARLLLAVEPRLSGALGAYLKAGDAEERHFQVAKAALEYRISPQVYRFADNSPGRRKPADAADWWCSFDDEDFKKREQIQRTPAERPELAANPPAQEAEIAKLKTLGSGADWLARVALKRVKANADDPSIRPMLEAVVAAEELDCAGPESDRLIAAAKEALSRLDPKRYGAVAAPGEQYIATVNGRAIPRAAYLAFIASQVNSGRTDNEQFRALVKEELIRRELITMEAAALGLGTLIDPSRVVSREDGSNYIARQGELTNAYFIRYMAEHPITEQQIRSTYDAAVKAMGDKEYRVYHILVTSEGEAKSIIEMLRKGRAFEELAKRSIDAGSRDKGGDLSWSRANIYVQPFADAVTRLSVGQYTDTPVRTPFGYHVIQLRDVRGAVHPGLEAVRASLVQRLRQETIMRHIGELRSRARIE